MIEQAQIVLANYAGFSMIPRSSIESLGGAGGYSGALFWKIANGNSQLCLRRWPKTHPDRQRLNWIHTILRSVAEAGINFIPTPIVANSGESIVEHNGYFFELAPWLYGKATYESEPCHEKLDSAMTGLGKFHLAIRQSLVPLCRHQVPPSLNNRRQRLKQLQKELPQIRLAMETESNPRLASIAKLGKTLCDNFELLSGLIERQLSQSMQLNVIVQPVIRDVWHDHMLFDENRLSGIVDFGAMNLDTVSADLSRLCGSFLGDDREGWSQALKFYGKQIELSEAEKGLIEIYDRSSVLMSGLNWIDWIFVEKRQFADLGSIEIRLRKNLTRQATLVRGSGSQPTDIVF